MVHIPWQGISNLPQTILFQLLRVLGRLGNQRAPKNQADLCSKTTEKPPYVDRWKGSRLYQTQFDKSPGRRRGHPLKGLSREKTPPRSKKYTFWLTVDGFVKRPTPKLIFKHRLLSFRFLIQKPNCQAFYKSINLIPPSALPRFFTRSAPVISVL